MSIDKAHYTILVTHYALGLQRTYYFISWPNDIEVGVTLIYKLTADTLG